MPDIALRFRKDMLVLSSPVEAALARQGVDVDRDLGLITLVEPDSLQEAMRLESMAGAQCIVAPTANITPARMAQAGMEDRAADIVHAALSVVRELKPQHVLVEIGPCGLPLDSTSKASLNENRDQYARAARLLEGERFDAFFLNGFAGKTDLLCALMGIRKASDAPVFASVNVLPDGKLANGRDSLEEACAIMEEYGASVAGFATAAPIDDACEIARRAAASTGLPLLTQLSVAKRNPKQGAPTLENPYYCPDALVDAALRLRAAGVQFLRAAGNASPAYTGALAATVSGLDVAPSCLAPAQSDGDALENAEMPHDATNAGSRKDDELTAVADALRSKVEAALSGSAEE